MKRMVFPIFSKIALAFSGVLLCSYFLIRIFEVLNVYIYFLGAGATEIMPFITIPGVALLISAAAVFHYHPNGDHFLCGFSLYAVFLCVLPKQ